MQTLVIALCVKCIRGNFVIACLLLWHERQPNDLEAGCMMGKSVWMACLEIQGATYK